MPRVGFEPKIPMFEWAKTAHALDRAATMIGGFSLLHTFYALQIIFIRSLFLFQRHKIQTKFSNRCIK
jgi:hypothetical protein